MREPTPKTVYLKDYSPPPFLISSIDLDVDIREDHALVRATLALARNPKAADANSPLVLDGEELELVSVALDGRAAHDRRVRAWRREPRHRHGAAALHAGNRVAHPPAAEQGAGGPVRLEHRLFHAVRGAGFSPHHLVHRPARRDGALHQHHPRRARALSGAAVERQPHRPGRGGRRPPLGEMAGSVPQALLSLRHGGGEAGQARRYASSPAPDARPSLPSTSNRASSTSAASPCAA